MFTIRAQGANQVAHSLLRILDARARATLLLFSLLIVACGALIGPHDFAYGPCVSDGDCAKDQACSQAHTCGPANGQTCPVDGGHCASGLCSTDDVCCAETCSGPCQACVGGATCALLAVDAKGACPANHACSKGGRCYCPKQTFVGRPAPSVYLTGLAPNSVAAADLNDDGRPDLAVANSQGGASDGYFTVSVLLNKGDGNFAPQVVYSTGLGPVAVVAQDLNGDGKPDLAVADGGVGLGTGNRVSVLLNKGDGTFAPRVDYPTGQTPSSVAAQDLNGDGLPDLAVANSVDGTVSVLLNEGDGTFAAHVDYPAGQGPSSVAALDLNRDGKPDLIVANATDHTVSVLLGVGDGTFLPKVDYLVGHGPASVAAEDLNGDGEPDLAVANAIDNTVSVLLGQGDGTFLPRVDFRVGRGPSSVVAADLNDDGKPDLAVANEYDDTVSVLLNEGHGTFGPKTDFGTGGGAASVAAADLNGDGKTDLAVANGGGELGFFGSDTVSVLLNQGNGSFLEGSKGSYPTGSNPVAIVAADLDGDGRPDLVVANLTPQATGGTVSVLLRRADGTFAPRVDYAAGSYPQSVAASDFDGDGKTDLAVAASGGAFVLRNLGNGTFGPPVAHGTTGISIVSANTAAIAAVDVNGDGKPDLVLDGIGNDTNTVSVLINEGGGRFAAKVRYAAGPYPSSVVGRDLNGDGKPDLVVAHSPFGLPSTTTIDVVSVLLNKGNGTFAPPADYTTGQNPASVTAEDLSGDGKPDLAVANAIDNTVSVLLNAGDGTFRPRVDYPVGQGAGSIAAQDLNGDGLPDLAVIDAADNTVSVLLNLGDGAFAVHHDYPTGLDPSSLAIADLNGDGLPDLAVANFLDDTVSVLINSCAP